MFCLIRLCTDVMLFTLGSEDIDVGDEEQATVKLPPYSVAFKELLVVVTHIVAMLTIDWHEKKVRVTHSKLHDGYLTIL